MLPPAPVFGLCQGTLSSLPLRASASAATARVDLRGRDGLGLLLRPAKRAGMFHVGAVFRRERTELRRASADGNQADHGSEPQ